MKEFDHIRVYRSEGVKECGFGHIRVYRSEGVKECGFGPEGLPSLPSIMMAMVSWIWITPPSSAPAATRQSSNTLRSNLFPSIICEPGWVRGRRDDGRGGRTEGGQ